MRIHRIIFFSLFLFLSVNLSAQVDSALVKIKMVQTKLKGGAYFCEMVRLYSDDAASVSTCGEIGFFKTGELVKDYEATMLALKVGETSDIVKSVYGYHIIQLLEKLGKTYLTRHVLVKYF
jgi:peptidyl-prolyl cis-trans isomerase SurA